MKGRAKIPSLFFCLVSSLNGEFFSPICRILTVFGLELYLIIREGYSVTRTRLLLTIHYAVTGNDRCDQISVGEKLTLF